jgi:hypothetical protein
MTPDFSTRAEHPRLRPLDWLWLTVGLVLCTAALAGAWRASSTLARAQASLTAVRAATTADEGTLRDARARRRTESEKLADRAALTFALPPARVLADIEQALTSDTRLNGATLAYGDDLQVEMRIVARTPEAYDRFVERLQSGGRFLDLDFGAELRSGEMNATIKARYHIEEGS